MCKKFPLFVLLFLIFVVKLIGQNKPVLDYERISINNNSDVGIPTKNYEEIESRTKASDSETKDLDLKIVPGQCIIRYTSTYNSFPKGIEILKEYSTISNIIEKVTSNEVKKYKAVNSFLVSKMINDNITESECVASIRNTNFNSHKYKVPNSYIGTDAYNSARIMTITFDRNETTSEIIERVKNSSQEFLAQGIKLISIEPNYILTINYEPNDVYFYRQWGHTLINSKAGWDIEKGSSNILIGVIDTGIDTDHEDLKDNINKTYEYDFVDIDTSAYKAENYSLIKGEDYKDRDSIAMDYYGHGTHCAGIIGAKGNNSIGVCGVGYNLSLVALRAGFAILTQTGDEAGVLETDDIIAAIDYAALVGINVVSMSFGGTDYSEITEASCKNAFEKGVVLVAAAGNNTSNKKSYPAAYENVISVSAVDVNDSPASFTNYGYWVDVAAPGVSIYSTVPKIGGILHNSTGYSYLSGTSMAAPFVAGLAGLILSKNPSVTPETVEYIIMNSLDEIGKKNFYYGLGRINVYKAMQMNLSDVPHMEVSITNLPFDNILKTSTNVLGTATGDNYTLSIGLGVYPTEWTVLNTGTTTTDGILGTINASSVTSGGYTVRLLTKIGDFSKEIRTYIRISNNADIKPGFPINITVDKLAYHFTLVDDLDFDGKKEIIVYSRFGYIDIFNCDGSVYKNGPIKLPEEGRLVSQPAIFDFNNDGTKEIVAMCLPGFNSSNVSTSIYVFNLNGSIQNGWPKSFGSPILIQLDQYRISIADINKDGKYEIIAKTVDDVGFFFIVYDSMGNVLDGWPYYFDKNYYGRSEPVIGDIDGDGEKEIVVTKFYNLSPNEVPHYIIALDAKGKIETNYSYKLKNWGWVTAGADIDNDSRTEIMTQDGMIGEYGNKLTWSLSKTCVYSNAVFADMTNDSKLEIFYGDSNLGAYLTDCMGNPLSGWPVYKEKYSADGNHVIGDIDNDGSKEIIIGFEPNTFDSRDQKPGLNVYNISGKPLTGYPKFNGIYYFDNYFIDDIDNDGLTDIICVDIKDGMIIAVETDGSYNTNNQGWPTFLHDNRNTNNYNSSYDQPVLFDIDSIKIDEDKYASIRFSPSNLDWDSYTVNTKADVPSIELIANKGTLSIIPPPDWNGSSIITITMEKENVADSSKINLVVNPIDDVPSVFNLTSPVDSTVIQLSANNCNENLCFKWERPYECDNDSLTFNVRFENPFNFLNSTTKEIDSITIPLETINNYMKVNTLWKANLKWYVLCSDGVSKVDSKQSYSLIINRINSDPAKFDLLSPSDSSNITLSSKNMGDSICFRWNKSIDSDNDSLQYLLVFENPFDSLSSDLLQNDSIKLPYRVFYDYLKQQNLLSEKIEWKVLCFDGVTSIESTSEFVLFIKRENETGLENGDNDIPKEFYLSQNYPNPFNPATVINYSIAKPSFVNLKIYDILGREVATIVDEFKDIGNYKIQYNCSNLASGIYFYKIKAGDFVSIKKFILIK